MGIHQLIDIILDYYILVWNKLYHSFPRCFLILSI